MAALIQSINSDPIRLYERYVREGKLKNDDAQRIVIGELQKLHQALMETNDSSLLNKIIRFHVLKKPKSLYIWGAVGRGKSLLMDIFHQCCAVSSRRVHFHAFMAEMHADIHAFRRKQMEENPVEHVALTLSNHLQLFCLDEFEVKDVADAMILSKLFTTILDNDVACVITSNLPPEELYMGGLQREKYLSFVDFIYERMEVLHLSSPHDYRLQQIRALKNVYMCPVNDKTSAALRDTFASLCHHAPLQPITLEVQGRRILVSECYGGIARFSFAELCERPLGAPDYMAIATRFHTILLSGIPKMTEEKRNEARRLVMLIDALYDHRVKFICTAEVPATELYTEGDGHFEFKRTVSRLAEMQSESYLATAHIP